MSNRADLRERTETSSYGDRGGQIADFRDSFERIKWQYLLFKCEIQTKTHFEWVPWHWSLLCQLNLEHTRPNGLMDCTVPTDIVKLLHNLSFVAFLFSDMSVMYLCMLKMRSTINCRMGNLWFTLYAFLCCAKFKGSHEAYSADMFQFPDNSLILPSH